MTQQQIEALYAEIRTLKEQKNAVIATGGGLPIYHDNMDILLESGTVLYLRCV